MRAREKAADVSRKALKTEDVTIVQEMFCVCKKERLQAFAKQLRRETLLDNHCTRQSQILPCVYLLHNLCKLNLPRTRSTYLARMLHRRSIQHRSIHQLHTKHKHLPPYALRHCSILVSMSRSLTYFLMRNILRLPLCITVLTMLKVVLSCSDAPSTKSLCFHNPLQDPSSYQH